MHPAPLRKPRTAAPALAVQTTSHADGLKRRATDWVVDAMVDSLAILSGNGLIRRVNPAFSELLGYTAEELQGRPFTDFIERADADGNLIDRLSEQQLIGRSEKTYVARDGRRIPVLFSGTAIRRGQTGGVSSIVCMALDITERRRAEAQRRLIVEAAPVAMMIVGEAGRIVQVNAAGVELFGYTRSQLLGQPMRMIFPDDTVDEESALRQAFASAPTDTITRLRWAGLRADGRTVPTEIAVKVIASPDGPRALVTAVDLTERNRLEAELRHAQKLEAVGELSAGVAHEFNNLLMGMKGCAEIASELLDDKHPAVAFMKEIEATVARASSISRQLLTFSRKGDAAVVVVDLHSAVVDAQQMLQRLLGEELALAVQLEASHCLVQASPGQLEHVLVNLALNARDAMPGGGHLSIATHDVPSSDVVLPGGDRVPCVALVVSDDGEGMPHEVRERAFEPFFTTKDVGRGTGLGLSVVYGAVQRAGGDIRLHSEQGRGTTVEILLRRAEADAVAPKSAPRRPARVEPHRSTVLLVEDEPTVRLTVRRYLEGGGFRVLDASDPMVALEVSRRLEDRIDLLVTDVVLPCINGGELARQLRAMRPGLRCLFMSAHDEAWLLEEGRLLAGSVLLSKPFEPDDLLRAAHALLQGS